MKREQSVIGEHEARRQRGGDIPNDLVKVAAGGCRVRKSQPDGFLGVDNENSSDLQALSDSVPVNESFDVKNTDGEGEALGVPVGGVLLVQHVVQNRDPPVLVGNLNKRNEHVTFPNALDALTMGN